MILYHVSPLLPNELFDEGYFKMVPRIPNDRLKGENRTTKRISFSDNPLTAMMAAPEVSIIAENSLRKYNTPTLDTTLFVYKIDTNKKGIKNIKLPEQVYLEGVIDAMALREYWVMEDIVINPEDISVMQLSKLPIFLQPIIEPEIFENIIRELEIWKHGRFLASNTLSTLQEFIDLVDIKYRLKLHDDILDGWMKSNFIPEGQGAVAMPLTDDTFNEHTVILDKKQDVFKVGLKASYYYDYPAIDMEQFKQLMAMMDISDFGYNEKESCYEIYNVEVDRLKITAAVLTQLKDWLAEEDFKETFETIMPYLKRTYDLAKLIF